MLAQKELTKAYWVSADAMGYCIYFCRCSKNVKKNSFTIYLFIFTFEFE